MRVVAGCQAVGVDSSPTMLAHARQKRLAAELSQLDAAQLPFAGEFDAAVISPALYETLPQVREQAWACMHRAVRPGRRLALD
jgi:SAM-dependent methyltransferase